jgi:hypothetical protein
MMFVTKGAGPSWIEMPHDMLKAALKQGVEFQVGQLARVARTQYSRTSEVNEVLAVQLSSDRRLDQGHLGTILVSDRSATCWLNGEFLSVDEARVKEFSGRNALRWAIEGANGAEVKRVVKAANGYYYPCSEYDISVKIGR